MSDDEPMPEVMRFNIGECEMLKHKAGRYMTVESLRRVIDWVIDHDDRDIMLEKLEQVKTATES